MFPENRLRQPFRVPSIGRISGEEYQHVPSAGKLHDRHQKSEFLPFQYVNRRLKRRKKVVTDSIGKAIAWAKVPQMRKFEPQRHKFFLTNRRVKITKISYLNHFVAFVTS